LLAVCSRYPGIEYLVFDVTGDGNCCDHSAAATLKLLEPNRLKWHYYFQNRHQVCDMLQRSIDNRVCSDPNFPTLSQLALFQSLLQGDLDDKVARKGKFVGRCKDIDGKNPPPQKNKSDKDWKAAIEMYLRQCEDDREAVKTRIWQEIEDNRALGTFNCSVYPLGLAMLTKKVVEVFNCSKGDNVFKLKAAFESNDCDNSGDKISLFYDAGGVHYYGAVPAAKMANYQPKPKNEAFKIPSTHNAKGKPISASRPVGSNKKTSKARYNETPSVEENVSSSTAPLLVEKKKVITGSGV
jgi:hypothetical protein